MHPYTVYGIETSKDVKVQILSPDCMHPYTVYGIETQILNMLLYDASTELHAPLYRLRY